MEASVVDSQGVCVNSQASSDLHLTGGAFGGFAEGIPGDSSYLTFWGSLLRRHLGIGSCFGLRLGPGLGLGFGFGFGLGLHRLGCRSNFGRGSFDSALSDYCYEFSCCNCGCLGSSDLRRFYLGSGEGACRLGATGWLGGSRGHGWYLLV